jgi:hypothetical protein
VTKGNRPAQTAGFASGHFSRSMRFAALTTSYETHMDAGLYHDRHPARKRGMPVEMHGCGSLSVGALLAAPVLLGRASPAPTRRIPRLSITKKNLNQIRLWEAEPPGTRSQAGAWERGERADTQVRPYRRASLLVILVPSPPFAARNSSLRPAL